MGDKNGLIDYKNRLINLKGRNINDELVKKYFLVENLSALLEKLQNKMNK